MLDYNNTKPLSHFEAGTPRGPVNTQSQNKAAMLNLLHQQPQMKPRPTGMPFRPPTHLPHSQVRICRATTYMFYISQLAKRTYLDRHFKA